MNNPVVRLALLSTVAQEGHGNSLTPLVICMAISTALNIALLGWIVAREGSAPISKAIFTAASTFAGALTLIILLITNSG